MKLNTGVVSYQRCIWLLLVFALSGISGCAVHIAPDYAPETANEIVQAERLIDKFYADLLAVPADQRTYDKFAENYRDIKVEIRVLILRCKIQPLNEDSTKMAETLLDLWQKVEAKHKQKGTYSDVLATIDQERFDGLLTSMAIVEEAKKKPTNP